MFITLTNVMFIPSCKDCRERAPMGNDALSRKEIVLAVDTHTNLVVTLWATSEIDSSVAHDLRQMAFTTSNLIQHECSGLVEVPML
jgi:hypothetical protein